MLRFGPEQELNILDTTGNVDVDLQIELENIKIYSMNNAIKARNATEELRVNEHNAMIQKRILRKSKKKELKEKLKCTCDVMELLLL
jgi:hypothetical protein